MEVKTILLDFDGTIVNTENYYLNCWNKVLGEFNVQVEGDDFFENYAGVPTSENTIHFISKFNLPISPANLLKKRVNIEEKTLKSFKYPLMPYAGKAIKYFYNRGIQLGIVTNSKRKHIDYFFCQYDFVKYFNFLVTRDDVSSSKPSPESYILAINKARCDKSNIIAIEDSKAGVESAVSAGLTCFAIQENSKIDESLSQASVIFRNFGHIISHFEDIEI